jgi:hypothetical protein
MNEVATPSLISELIEANEKASGSADDVHIIKGLGATAFSGSLGHYCSFERCVNVLLFLAGADTVCTKSTQV